MSFYELDNTEYLMYDSHYGSADTLKADFMNGVPQLVASVPQNKCASDEDIQNGSVTVYSNESIKQNQLKQNQLKQNQAIPALYKVATDTSQDNVKGVKESFQAKINDQNQKFVEQQSKSMLSLIEIIDAYQKENNDLKNKMNEKEQVCKLQLDYANSELSNISEPHNLKQYIKIEILMLVLLLIFIIYFYLM